MKAPLLSSSFFALAGLSLALSSLAEGQQTPSLLTTSPLSKATLETKEQVAPPTQEKETLPLTLNTQKPVVSTPKVATSFAFPPSPAEVEAAMNGNSSSEEESKGGTGLFYEEQNPSAPPSFKVLAAPSSESSAWTSRLGVGYESNYSFKNLILSSRFCKNGVITSQLGGDYALDNGGHLSIDYLYDEVLAGKLSENNAHQLALAYKEEYLPDFYLQAGYNLFHGGFPGIVAKRAHHKRHALVQEFDVSAELVFASGFYTRVNTTYSFQGITGWWFGVEGGYRHDINDFTLLTLSAYSSTSQSYFNTNGLNQIGMRVQFDYTITDQWSVRSFMATEWMLNTALNINHAMGSHFFRPFTFFVGKSVTYTF